MESRYGNRTGVKVGYQSGDATTLGPTMEIKEGLISSRVARAPSHGLRPAAAQRRSGHTERGNGAALTSSLSSSGPSPPAIPAILPRPILDIQSSAGAHQGGSCPAFPRPITRVERKQPRSRPYH